MSKTPSVLQEGECNIELVSKKQNGSFDAGGKVDANVKLTLVKPLEVRGLVVKLHGYIKTEWDHSIGPNTIKRGARQELVVLEQKIFSSMSQGLKTYPPGTHEFRVRFDLPKSIPSSFEGTYGFVRYTIYVLAKTDQKTEMLDPKRIHIVCPLDLNSDPINGVPWNRSEVHDIGCFPGIGGSISMAFQIDKRGYIPGESIALFGQIHNNTKLTMSFSRCSLVQKVKYIQDKWHDKKEKIIVDSIKHDPTKPGSTDSWNGDELKIPKEITTNLDNCRLIQVKYLLKLEVKLSLSLTHTLLNIAIKMGNIPAAKATRAPFKFR